VDYRQLNAISEKRVYAPPPIRDIRQRIGRSEWFSKYDLEDAYYHIRIWPEHIYLTAFRTKYGIYEFLVMPFGLTSAPAVFQQYIELVLGNCLGKGTEAFIDDILVHARTKQQHDTTAREVEKRLRARGLRINEMKTIRSVREIDYVGMHIRYGITTANISDETIRRWPRPRNAKETQIFLGMANYFRDYVRGYAQQASPLYEMTKPNAKWDWKMDRAFNGLKNALQRTVDIAVHECNRPATMTTDASNEGISAVLMQEGRVTALISRALTRAERNYDTPERELLAIVWATEKWHWLIETTPSLTICTDHANLLSSVGKRANRKYVRWNVWLGQFNIRWTHVAGRENRADVFSRRQDYMDQDRDRQLRRSR